ncbi:diguanylate cyclase domain-containing protein [Anaerobacillus sp. MEB173]|uniref:diguanylate cyclase domain-containing protein n=1 Tax=Anaerobacillus sp. MEB173 TaxID=3383345 RepID=UPI003F8FA1D8
MEMKTKIYIPFFSLFLLMLFSSCFALYNAYENYQESSSLHIEYYEVGESLFELEQLTFSLSFLAQKHILSQNEETMDLYEQEIVLTIREMNDLINRIVRNMTFINNPEAYSSFRTDWQAFWKVFETMLELSRENNDLQSHVWLINANAEIEELNAKYLQPFMDETYAGYRNLLLHQHMNFQRYLLLGLFLMTLSIIGFIFTFYYIRGVLNETTELKEKLKFLAFHDELTSLPNRRMFEQIVTESINEPDSRFSVFYLDMDKFKYINDNYGHDIGDLVLIEFVRRVSQTIRETDLMGRQGGDEFTILIRDNNEEKIACIAERIISSLQDPLCVNGITFNIATSIGIAMYPQHGTDYLSLLKNSDMALYEAKKTRNTFKFHNIETTFIE